MEIDTGLFEREFAILEDASHLGFNISNDVLILHLQNFARKYGIPVSHEVDVPFVIAADLFEPIGKLLPLGKQLLKPRERARHGIASRVDDFGIWQNKMDESDVPKVVRHFIGEPWRTFMMNFRILHISVAEFSQLVAGKLF